VPLNNPDFLSEGLWYPVVDSTRVIFNRHTKEVLLHPESGISATSRPYAYTQTGVRIRFKTASPFVHMEFEQREEGGHLGLENGFAIYADNQQIAIKEKLNFTINTPAKDSSVVYKVLLPSLYAINLTEISIADGHHLKSVKPSKKPTYAAIGNSITHGTGHQSASFLTYPYVLADSMEWNLHNLAVAGARTGWPVSLLFKDKKVDYITILLGFNDWMWDNKPLSDKLYQYEKLLDSLLSFQPDAEIFCITPLTTTKTETQLNAPFDLQDYRTMLIRHVSRRRNLGDKNLHIIHGDSISNPSMLMDGIHLSKKGAPLFACNLKDKIREILASKTGLKQEKIDKFNFKLEQNYPNPFNPVTNIRLALPKSTHVELSVYNLLGQQVAKIIDQQMNIGDHNIIFNSGELAGGIYLYKIQTERFSDVKKMVIMK
jgi:lysophospholipase L1-like esterase